MSTNDTMGLEPDEQTEKRARWESFSYEVPRVGGVVVRNHSHGEADVDAHTYRVTVRNGSATECTCPSDEYRERPCKHRVAVESEPAVLAAAAGIVRTDGGRLVDPDAPEYELVDTGAGSLVYERSEDGREKRLVGFHSVTDWKTIEDAVRARGHAAGDVLHLPELSAAEVE